MKTAIARLLLAFFLFDAIAAAAFAQPVPLRSGETIEVSIVNVDVFVTDRAGNRVRGLTRDDFELYENGVRQEIANFAEYAGAGEERVGVETAAAPEEAAAPREPRNLLLFVERMRLPKFSAEPMVEEIRNVVRRTIEPGDSVSIVIWSRHGGTEHLEFTGDMSRIDAELGKVARTLQIAHLDHTSSLRDEAALLAQFERNARVSPGFGGAGAVNLAMLVAYGEMKVRVNAIHSAIQSMAGLPGKKVLLLAARRLGEVAGAEYAYATGHSYLSYELRNRFGTDSLLQSLADAANASGVTVYPIYPLSMGSFVPDLAGTAEGEMIEGMTMANERSAQATLAARTGGMAAVSAHDIIRLLPRIASDVTDYYSLAYRIRTTGKDVSRDIVVKTKDPSLRVRARRELVEKSDDTQMRDRLRASFFRTSHESQIRLDATVGAKKRRGKSTLPLQVRIPVADLTTLPQDGRKHAGSFSVYVATAADLDELSDITKKTQPFDIAEKDLERAKDSHFTYDLDLTVNAKAKYVAIGVFDEVGRTWGVTRLELETRTAESTQSQSRSAR